MGDFVIGIEGWAHVLIHLFAIVDRVFDNWSGGDWGWGYNGDGLLDLLNWLLGNLLLSTSLSPGTYRSWGGTGELLESDLSLEKRFQAPEVNCNHTNPEQETSTVGMMFLVVFSVTVSTMTSMLSMMSSLLLIISEFFIIIFILICVDLSVLVDAKILGEASLEWNTSNHNHVTFR